MHNDCPRNSKYAPHYSKYTKYEYEGTTKIGGKQRDISRTVYQRNDIDWFQIDVNTNMTNWQLIKKGYAPYARDGSRIELHHLLQVEPGNMVEIPGSLHDKYTKQLHGMVEYGGSFRNNPVLEKQYNNFRKKYWKQRYNDLTKTALIAYIFAIT